MLSARFTPVSAPTKARQAPFVISRPALRQRSLHVVRVTDVNTATFDEQVLQADTPVLVDFWSTWCGPCRLVAPMLGMIEKEFSGTLKVVKVEHDSNPDLIAKYKVYGLPTLIVFKEGKEVEGSKREGAITKAQLVKYLAQHGVALPSQVLN